MGVAAAPGMIVTLHTILFSYMHFYCRCINEHLQKSKHRGGYAYVHLLLHFLMCPLLPPALPKQSLSTLKNNILICMDSFNMYGYAIKPHLEHMTLFFFFLLFLIYHVHHDAWTIWLWLSMIFLDISILLHCYIVVGFSCEASWWS